MIETGNEQNYDSIVSIDVNRVGFTSRTSVALTNTEDGGEGPEEHSHGYADDPYSRAPVDAHNSIDK
jgi:hypothetical protein